MVSYIKNIVSEDECKILIEHFEKEKSKNTNNKDQDVPIVNNGKNSYGLGYIQLFDDYVEKLKHIVENIINDKTILLENINSYIREYKNGSFLQKHIDRNDIDVTVSICLKNSKTNWPLNCLIDDNILSHDIKAGDALLIMHSNKFEHWRDTLVCEEDESVIQLYLMYRIKNKKNKTTLL